MKNVVLKNVNILNGTKEMELMPNASIRISNGIIKDIGEFEIDKNDEIVDLSGKYIVPGLINLHSHLPSSGKPSKKKLGDVKKLVKFILSNPITRAVGLQIEKKSALASLYSGVTTVRTVGGVGNIDSILRDKINSGKIVGPRLLVANTAIGVPGGHMDGTVSIGASSIEEIVELVNKMANDKVDLIKLMITGGVLDGQIKGKPAPLRMNKEMVKAACDKAHELGFKVAAHVESSEGIKVAIENGVDSIEHGAPLDDKLIKILKERDGAVVCTLSPAIPLAVLDSSETPYGEIGKINTQIVLDGVISASKSCIENNIKIGLGTDAGSTFVSHYNFWRELPLFVKYCGATPKFALYAATLGNAIIAGVNKETGSIEVGKSADLLIIDSNPLENNFLALKQPHMVIIKGKIIKDCKIKRNVAIEQIVEKTMGF